MRKHLIFKIVTIWFLITQSFPPYDYYVRVKGVVTIGLFVLIAILLFPDLLSSKSIVALFFYTVAVFLVYFRGNDYYENIAMVIVPSLTMLSALLITEYSIKYDSEYKYTKASLLTLLITNFIMIALSIPQLMINPNIIRGASTFGIEGGESMVYYWIISYETVHGFPLLFAPLLFLCKKTYHEKKLFVFYVFVFVALFYIVLKSNATTALLVSILMILVGLLFDNERFDAKNIAKMIALILLFGMIMSSSVMVPMLDAVQSAFDPSSSNYRKVNDIRDSFMYGEAGGDMGLRQSLYNQSRDLFFAEPLMGTSNSGQISKHTWLWDQLACMGIFFFSTFIILFVFHVKKVYRSLGVSKLMYLWGVGALMIMLYYKNSFGPGTWLYGFAILPLLCRYVDNIIKTEQI